MRPSEPNSGLARAQATADIRATCSAGHGRNHVQVAVLVEDGRQAGYPFSQPDLIIAATALHHGLTVVTRNVSDYERVRAPVFNPWVGPQPSAS